MSDTQDRDAVAAAPLKDFLCRGCKARLGMHNETCLQVGMGIFKRSVDINCAKCGKRTRWMPIDAPPERIQN